MLTHLNEFLSESSADWGLPTADRWSFWLYNNIHPHSSSVDVMWFCGSEKAPRVVTKMHRKHDKLAREFESLALVHAHAPGNAPKPLGFRQFGQFWTLWMEGLPGVPFQKAHASQNLRQIVDLLLGIHVSLCQRDGASDPSRYQRMVVEPLEDEAHSATSDAVREGCRRLLGSISQEWLNSLPAIPQHGDFYSENITWFQGRPRVLDWETFGKVDLPMFDLVTFLASLLIPDGGTLAAADPETARAVPAAIELYRQGIGLSAADLEILLPLALVNWHRVMKLDGRDGFVARMQRWIEDYFEHPAIWRRTFLPSASWCV